MQANLQSGDGWSQTATSYASDSIIKIPEYYSQRAAEFLLKDFSPDGALRFLDVAAGVGTLTSEVLKRLSVEQLHGSSVDVTDFSSGMVAQAESLISIDSYSMVNKTFKVMNAQALEFPDHSFSHVGCMFGIMFFPDRAKGLSEMFRVLQLDGVAVIGTWNNVDNMPLCLEFAAYLGLKDIKENSGPMLAVLSACGEPAVFEEELAAVGFQDIAITQVERTFSLPNNEEFFQGYALNPGMKPFMGGVEAFPRWQEYLRTEGSKWVNEEGRISLRFVGNIAVAKK